jgi:hypothetical protein
MGTDEIAAELGVSVTALTNWQNRYGPISIGSSGELARLRQDNARLKQLLATAGISSDNRAGELTEVVRVE